MKHVKTVIISLIVLVGCSQQKAQEKRINTFVSNILDVNSQLDPVEFQNLEQKIVSNAGDKAACSKVMLEAGFAGSMLRLAALVGGQSPVTFSENDISQGIVEVQVACKTKD